MAGSVDSEGVAGSADSDGAAGSAGVAARAGVPLASTTYYFASRDELVAAAFEHLATSEIAELESGARQLPARLSIDEAAALLSAAVAADFEGRLVQLRAEHELHLEAGRVPELRATHERWEAAAMGFFVALVRAAGSRDPEGDAAILLCAVSGLQLGQLANPDPEFEDELLQPVIHRLLSALIADG